MATEVERLLVTLEANLAKYQSDLVRAQAVTNRQLGVIETRFATMSARLKSSVSTAALGVGSILGGLSAYLGTRELMAYADSWRTVERTIEGSQEVFGIALRSAEELNKLANEARVDNEAYAKLYVRTAAAVRELGYAEEDVAKATSTVAMALKLGSASASEQASTMLQLSQALQKGKLDGDEFRTVMENAGVIQELLADKLKVSKGAIVSMAAEGKLKVETLMAALVEGNDVVERIFKRLPATIEESFTVLNNQIEQYIGHLNNAYGGSDALIAVVTSLANNIEGLGDGVVTLGAGLLAAFAPRIIAAVAALPFALAAAVGPVGILAGGFAALAVGADVFGDKIAMSADGMVTLQDFGRATLELLQEEVAKLLAYFDGMPGAVGINTQEAVQVIRAALNAMIGAAVFAVKTVAAAITTVPGAVAEAVIDGVNALIRGVQSMLDAVTDGVNNLIAGLNAVPGVDLGFLVAPDLGQVANAYRGAGEAAGAAFYDAASSLTRDYIAEAGEAAGRVFDAIDARARQISENRVWREGTKVNRDIAAKPKYENPAGADRAAEKARRQFEKDLLQLENRIELEKLEAEAIGRSAYEAERMRVKQELLNEARKAGISLTEADRIKIDALADAMARATTETEAMRQAMQSVSAESKEALSQFVRDLKDGKSGAEALAGVLDNISNKLIDMAVNDLVEVALGGLTGRGGNPTAPALGGGLMQLFGFANGGVMIPGRGPVNLPRFARGGVSRSAAIFGEAGPEAAVPLPDGRRIPVDLRMPSAAGSGQAPSIALTVAPTFNVANGTPEGVDKLRAQVAKEMPALIRREVANIFDRNARFARSRI